MPPELELPALPDAGAWLYSVWRELAAARGGHGFGPQPLDWATIAAWQSLMDVSLSPWEIETLRTLDAAALAAMEKPEAESACQST